MSDGPTDDLFEDDSKSVDIDFLLKLEREYRKHNAWLIWIGFVKNDAGKVRHVAIKSFGFHNQILRIDKDGINRCAGHTISKVKDMHAWIRDKINAG